MSEISFEEMLEDSLKTIHSGDVVDGVVISVKPDEAVLNIGYKADAILSKEEYSNEEIEDLRLKLNEGDTLPVKILRVNDKEGQVTVSYKRFIAEKGNQVLYDAYKEKRILKGKVIKIVKGGITAETEGVGVFIPASLISDVFHNNVNELMGEEIEFIISEFNPRKKRIIGNRRYLIEEEKKKIRDEIVSKISEGDVIKGVVSGLTKFGAFVDIGGVDGLIHITEMSWGTVLKPSEVVKVGDEIDVIVKKITDDKISLSLKFDDKNPWNNIRDHVKIGDVKTGRVVRLADFGAFVELEPGIEGLLHVSQISRKHIDKVSDALKLGQEIEVKIIDFIEEDKRISLSSKVLEPVEESEEVNEEVNETEDNANEDTSADTLTDSNASEENTDNNTSEDVVNTSEDTTSEAANDEVDTTDNADDTESPDENSSTEENNTEETKEEVEE